jgi:hypothetical protein
MEPLERLKTLAGIIGDSQDGLLAALLDDALEWMSLYAGRPEWMNALPDSLNGLRVRVALNNYNRRGVEGMSGASEGGVSRTIEAIPEDIRRALNGWRLARIVSITESRRSG